MRITYLGHSAVLLDTDEHRIIIDPFLDGNPASPVRAADVRADFVIVTHAHGDHWGSSLDLARAGATIVSTAEIAAYAEKHGAKGVRAMNIGGSANLPFGRVKFTPAWHSSSFPDGTYGGMPMGVLVEAGGKTLYHAGDTALFSDMRLIGAAGIDVAFLPIGDNFTMGPADALVALDLLTPHTVVPIHYNTFPVIKQDAQAFSDKASEKGVAGKAMKAGEEMML